MVSDSVKFLVDTMLKNDVENNTASTNTEEIHLSPKAEEERTACKAEQIHKMTTIVTQNDH